MLKPEQFDRIDRTLDAMLREFNEQIQAIGNPDHKKEFHREMIKLSSKYKEHAELIEFIVLVNDKLETKHEVFSDIVIDSFNILVQNKKQLIHNLRDNTPIDKPEEPKSLLNKLKSVNISDLKIIVAGIAIIVVSIVSGIIITIQPEIVTTIITSLGSKE